MSIPAFGRDKLHRNHAVAESFSRPTACVSSGLSCIAALVLAESLSRYGPDGHKAHAGVALDGPRRWRAWPSGSLGPSGVQHAPRVRMCLPAAWPTEWVEKPYRN